MHRYLTKSLLTAHIKRDHINPPGVCDFCGKEFKCKYNLTAHRNEAHMGSEIKRVQCTVCDAWMRKSSLYTHIKSHNANVEPCLVCSICSKEVKDNVALKNHIRNVHGNREHLCTVCGKAFQTSLALKVRKNARCHYNFILNLIDFQEHMAVHTGEHLYECRYCTKTFKSNGNMHSHHKKAHFDKWDKDRKERLIHVRNKYR